MSLADVVTRKLSDVPKVSSTVGIFMTMVGGLARVNLQGASVDIRCDGWTPPIPGMPVRVESLNGAMRVVGPSQALSPRGEVVGSLDGGVRALVRIDGTDHVLPVMAPYVPVLTDIVIVNWQSGHVLGEEAAEPEVEELPPAAGGGSAFTGLLITPTASGKYDTEWANWWAPPEVWASDNNKGIWVYGGRFAALAGANITKTWFHFPPPLRVSGAASIGLHTYDSIPGGNPTITDLITVPPDRRSGWFELPASWGTHLRDNPQCGVGVVSGAGYNRWPGVGQAGGGQSGWMRFDGTR